MILHSIAALAMCFNPHFVRCLGRGEGGDQGRWSGESPGRGWDGYSGHYSGPPPGNFGGAFRDHPGGPPNHAGRFMIGPKGDEDMLRVLLRSSVGCPPPAITSHVSDPL